jgi:hydroxypyruvate reductase
MSEYRAYTGHDSLNAIVHAALERADSAEIIHRCLQLDGNVLRIGTESQDRSFDLSVYRRVFVVAVGKAAGRMARALEEVLGDRIDRGMAVTKYGHAEKLSRIELAEAGHPVPDEAGVGAARKIEELLGDADEQTLVITLISGGGSALLVSPFRDRRHELTLGDMQQVTQLLLSCGAAIHEINCVRKHLSNVKGGRLARLIAPATSVNLILSDVVGDEPSSIASGITAPDPSTFGQALDILRRYEVETQLPEMARRIINDGAAGRIPETPKEGEGSFDQVYNIVIGSNSQALQAAADAARLRGYEPVLLTARLEGEAREVARIFPAIARDIRGSGMLASPPVVVLAGGETTVTIRDEEGKGGRNQEIALTVLREFARAPEAFATVSFASVATDGNDGPTDAAGGFVDAGLARRAAEDSTSLERALAHNDSYRYLEKLGALIRTGPTNTNVCDIQVLVVDQASR